MKLTFLDTNTTREISDNYIVKDSIKYEYKLLKDLSPSSNRVTLKLIKECPEVELIIAAKKDVKVEGDFVGYLSNNYTWTVTPTGQQALQVTIEDVGTRLLKKSFSKETLYKGKASDVLNSICQLAGVVRSDSTDINKEVCFIAEGTYADALSNLLRECGYTYYFTNEGKLAVKKFNFSEDATYVVDKTNLFSHSDKAITLTKKVKQYGLVDVSWKGIETLKNVYIYKDETGKDSTHPYCYIEVKDFYPSENGNYVQATNLNDSREIAFIENIVPEVSYTGDISYSITQHSPTTLDVRVENKSSSSSHLTKLQCRADATVYSEINNTTAGEADFEKYETEAVCIHSKEDVEEYANLLSNYYKYCNQTYSFYSTSDMELGNVCNLKDESFSGLDVKVYLIEKKVHSGYYEYTAVATSNFDINNAVSELINLPVNSPSQGEPGTTYYTWIKYAINQFGEEMSDSPEGKSYIGIAYNQLTPTPSNDPNDYQWTQLTGDSASLFEITLGSYTYIRDLRDTASNNEIDVTINVQGYSGTADIKVSAGTYVNGKLIIPYNNSYDTVTVTATLGKISKSITLSVIDKTKLVTYFGLMKSLPEGVILEGDYFTCSESFDTYQQGFAYEYVNGKWSDLAANNYKILDCLTDVINDRNITVPYNSAIYTWTKNLIAQDATIENLKVTEEFAQKIKATSGFFNDITVSGNSVFEGTVQTPVFTTQKTDGDQRVFSASNGSVADGLLGSEVKSVITSHMNGKTDKVAFNASGNVLGRSDFDKVMRVSSVSSSTSTLQTSNGSGTGNQTISFTNPKPIRAKIYITPSRKWIDEEYDYEYDYYEWEVVRTSTGGGNTYPSYSDRQEPDWEPDGAGEVHIQYTDIVETSNGYTWTMVRWESKRYTEEGTATERHYGTFSFNGNTYSSDTVISTTVDAGQTITVTLNGVSPIRGGDVVNSNAGKILFNWKESENYNSGIHFINNGLISFSLSNLTDDIYEEDVSLTVDGSSVVNCNSSNWTSGINKLFKFNWSNTATGSASTFASGSSVSVTYVDGTTKSTNDIYGFAYSPNHFSLTGGAAISLSVGDFVRAYNVNVTTYSSPKGVYAQNIYPTENDSWSLGDADSRWKGVYATDVNTGTITVSGNLSSTGEIRTTGYIYGDKVYGAVFN